MPSSQIPDPFLVSRIPQGTPLEPVALCAGFDGGKWRCTQLAKHLTEWVLEFSLRLSEPSCGRPRRGFIRRILPTEEKLANFFFILLVGKNLAPNNLLRACIINLHSTNKFMASIAFTFELALDSRIELWLGKSKLYAKADKAISAARQSIKEHLDRGFLRISKNVDTSQDC